jgi:hypothetical protein
MTQHSDGLRERPNVAMNKVIAELRRNYPSSVDVKTIKEVLKLSDRTVDNCLKNGVLMGLFNKSDRGTYVWLPFDENTQDHIKGALLELRWIFDFRLIPIEYISNHPLVGLPPEKIRDILFTLNWHDLTPEDYDMFAARRERLNRYIRELNGSKDSEKSREIYYSEKWPKVLPQTPDWLNRLKRFSELYIT